MVAGSPVGMVTGMSYPTSLVRRDSMALSRASGSRGGRYPRRHWWFGGVRHLRRHFGVSFGRESMATASAAFDQPERGKQQRRAADVGQWISRFARALQPQIVRHRSQLSRRLRAESGSCRRSAICRRAGHDCDLSGNQGNARNAGISSQHLPHRRNESVPACPAGFYYRTSGGNSTREAGQIQLRRRLRSGLYGEHRLHLGEGNG